MIIQCLNHFVNSQSCVCVRHTTAQMLDWVAALALLIIGTLGACGVFTASTALVYSLLGAGVFYTFTMMLLTANIACSKKRN